MKFLLKLHFVLSMVLLTEGKTAHWSYSNPDHWPDHFKNCSGTRQSPVDLVSSALVQDASLQPFSFTNFRTVRDIHTFITNNGHSVQVTYDTDDLLVNGGSLGGEYVVAQYHFHWGSKNTMGSEHTLDGRAFPMEMHVVTYNGKYPDISTAVRHEDGLAVLGFFFQVSPTDNPAFTPITDALAAIQNVGSFRRLESGPLAGLLPADLSLYYRYQGGLTTPPCSEIVTWTLFREPIAISDTQLAAFRSLKSPDQNSFGVVKALQDNFRPVQPLMGRSVRVNFAPGAWQ